MKETRQAAYERRQREKGATLVALRLDKETADLLDRATKIHGSKTAALKRALKMMMETKKFVVTRNAVAKTLMPYVSSAAVLESLEKDLDHWEEMGEWTASNSGRTIRVIKTGTRFEITIEPH